MTTTLLPNAVEKSTYAVTAQFTDEDGDAVIPNSVTWSLTDLSGAVINERDQVSISPASSICVVLSGDDLALESRRDGRRVVTVEAVYSSTLGASLPLKAEQEFKIINLAKIT